MLDAYSVNLPVTAGTDIPLNVKRIENNGVTLNGATISFKKAGVYKVTVNATGSSTEAGSVGIQLFYSNGKAIEGAMATAGTAAGIKVNLALATALIVEPARYSTANFTVRNIGSSGTLDAIEIVVTRLA